MRRILGLAIAVLAMTGVAHAQSGDVKALAEQLFNQARDLAKANRWSEACPKFEASLRYDPVLGTRLNLAACYEHIGKLASAWGLYRESIELAKKAGDLKRHEYAQKQAAALVFVRAGTTWTQQAYIKASNTNAYDYFGHCVALSGNSLAVGALLEDSAATGINGNQDDNSVGAAGAVYVFVRAGTTWTQKAYIKASNTGMLDQFGFSVGLSDDTLAIGAAFESSGATGVNSSQSDDNAGEAGAVYVFR
jgi:tetratricopeptide (TPR) repeat protein